MFFLIDELSAYLFRLCRNMAYGQYGTETSVGVRLQKNDTGLDKLLILFGIYSHVRAKVFSQGSSEAEPLNLMIDRF